MAGTDALEHDAAAWLAEHLDDVLLQPADEAAGLVIAAGLKPRTVREGDAMTMDYRTDRVTLVVTPGRTVSRAQAG